MRSRCCVLVCWWDTLPFFRGDFSRNYISNPGGNYVLLVLCFFVSLFLAADKREWGQVSLLLTSMRTEPYIYVSAQSLQELYRKKKN